MTQPNPLAVGDELPASWLDQFLTWVGAANSTYSPVLNATTTNPTLGTGGSTSGQYMQIGKQVLGHGLIQFGSSGTSAGNGIYLVTLPTPVDSSLPAGALLGIARLHCAALDTHAFLWLNSGVAGQCRLTYPSVYVNASTYVSSSNTAPGVWTANDFISFEFHYPST